MEFTELDNLEIAYFNLLDRLKFIKKLGGPNELTLIRYELEIYFKETENLKNLPQYKTFEREIRLFYFCLFLGKRAKNT